MKASIILVIALSICMFGYSKSQPPVSVYAVMTLFGGEYTETVVFTVKIDLKSGTQTRLVENFIYVGGSATYDGISDMDEETGVYYYSTDFATAFIYSSNVYTQTLLPTIDTGAQEVLNIHHDDTNKRLLSLQLQKTGAIYLVQVPTSLTFGKASVLVTLPNAVNDTGIMASVFDEKSQKFYLAAMNSTNSTGPYYISSYDVTGGDFITASPIPLSCPTGELAYSYPTSFYIDYAKQQLIIATEQFVKDGDIDYWVYVLPLDAKTCVAKKIPLTSFGIATAWTYYAPTRTFYFSYAPNGATQLFSYNIDTGALGQPITLQATPSSIQVSYK